MRRLLASSGRRRGTGLLGGGARQRLVVLGPSGLVDVRPNINACGGSRPGSRRISQGPVEGSAGIRGNTSRTTSTDEPRDHPAQERGGFPRVYMLLAALALENLAKGILIARDPALVTSTELPRRKSWTDHRRLPLWVRDAGVQLDQRQEEVLKRLGEAAQWSGRYPVPLTAESMRRRPMPKWRAPAGQPDHEPILEGPGTPDASDLVLVRGVWSALNEQAQQHLAKRLEAGASSKRPV